MATPSTILAWEIPWTEKPGGLQSKRAAKDSDTSERLSRGTSLVLPRVYHCPLLTPPRLCTGLEGVFK